ncbi:nicotinate-nucleotide--dimethylbenzimidazole phosphoribosyltransferase [Marinobacterium mangrovicola]|uniref:Nicotinate-nucleotide--dimethylbenzimidazole phosphoribosyltransferase n=1 Tax=Marinobacterium mangrovicola TaxID=1476959 RepID=A0A4R1G9U5_9GAMM|nr:nicotinate-nucleotide-dimethylbenzimidazole phosphoribosyltransferase [Marinobacterium mangrovicola]
MIDPALYGDDFIGWLEQPLATLDQASREQAQERQQQLTKPPGSLGELENIAVRLAAMQGRDKPTLDRVAIAVFAADHGVAAEGVSAFPQAVTAQMIANFSTGGAAISVLAKALGAELRVYNLGTVEPLPALAGVEPRIIAPQSGNLAQEAAMTEEQLEAALLVGREAVDTLAGEGRADLFIGGEMGIGNTTPAAALSAVLLGCSAAETVGPGTGLNNAGVLHKVKVVEQALALHQPHSNDSLELLRRLGGFELAALTGAYLHCAKLGVPALVDGYICSVAALLACRIQPGCEDWLFFAHRSAEPGYRLLAEALPSKPLLDLGFRLGEGSGAAVAVPLLRMACTLHNGMATFAEAAVSGSER